MNWKRVIASMEGLEGNITAVGLKINWHSVFVALPAKLALWSIVAVRYNDKIVLAPVLDIGPWNTEDNDYVFGHARPQSESGIDKSGRRTNRAGIDLSFYTIVKLNSLPTEWGLREVEWSFVTLDDIILENKF